ATAAGDGGHIGVRAMYQAPSGGHAAREDYGVAEVYGTLSARGGVQAGNGGQVETSGVALNTALALADGIRQAARVNASARAAGGRSGTWTLDPFNVVISNTTTVGVDGNFNPTASGANVNAADIGTALNNGTNVVISTDNPAGAEAGTITLASGTTISRTSGSAASSLTLRANDSILLDTGSAIVASNGTAFDINLYSDLDGLNSGSVFLNGANLFSGGGNIALGGGVAPASGFARGNGQQAGVTLLNSTVSTASTTRGNVVIRGAAGAGSTDAGVSITSSNITGRDISIAGQADHGSAIRVTSGTLSTDSGLIALRGVATRSGNAVGTTTAKGVEINGLSVQLGSGSLEVAGRGDGTVNNQAAVGVEVSNLNIVTASTTTGHITLAGQSVGSASTGFHIVDNGNNSGITLGAGSSNALPSLVGVSLGAISSSGLALDLGDNSSVKTVGAIDLRPLGVDVNGAITEQPATDILVALSTGGSGFIVDPLWIRDNGSFLPNGGFVLGSSLQTGNISVQTGALTSAQHGNLSLSLQNQGSGSNGIFLGSNNALHNLALLTTGSVTQGGNLTVTGSLVIAGGPASTVQLDQPGNRFNVVAFDPPDTLAVLSSGVLTLDAATAAGYDATTHSFTTLAITDSVGGSNVTLQSADANVLLNRSISMTGSGASLLSIVSPSGIVLAQGVTLSSASPTGRWRLFSPVVQGLAAPITNYYGCVFDAGEGFLCSGSALPDSAPGNQVLRPNTPTLTVLANPETAPAGTTPQLSYGVSGLLNGDLQTTALSGSLSAPVSPTSPPGNYAITQGTLSSPTGYAISFQGSTLTLTPGTGLFGIRALQSDFQAELRSDVYGRNLSQPYVCTAASLIRSDADATKNDPLATEWGKVRNQPQLSGCLDVTDGGQCAAF
ncbi:MAG TPA: MBG domain-containing protein, partial [Rhizobacter sp.]|nr:MBG domain-containing protein [Rhizobacter sp.]